MKSSLQLRIGQSLTMTPQLQQAIRLLQLSSIELQAEIREALESNMMLEADEGEAPGGAEEAFSAQREEPAPDPDAAEPTSAGQDNIPNELPVDSGWDDIYDPGPGVARAAADPNSYEGFENLDSGEQTLREQLEWQLNLTPTSDRDRIIALAIIDSLDDDGYLSGAPEDIMAAVAADLAEVTSAEVEAVLRLIQAMEPSGVGARDLRECLEIQLRQAEPGQPHLEQARALVASHLDLLAARDYNRLMRKLKLDRDELARVIDLIQGLNPRPGGQLGAGRAEYIAPDVYVKKINGAWRVNLNTEVVPSLRINAAYAGMIRRADNSADNTSLKTHLQEARWLIKSLKSRGETLLRVATSIVERQRAFLEQGEEAMQPLVLHDIAAALGLHESTISRVTSHKYMHTPRGIFELKYFFSSHVSADNGGACSSTAIRARIKKLISAEAATRPLSDNKIALLLKQQGIQVARRTVAKYREAMAIPPSNERKRLA